MRSKKILADTRTGAFGHPYVCETRKQQTTDKHNTPYPPSTVTQANSSSTLSNHIHNPPAFSPSPPGPGRRIASTTALSGVHTYIGTPPSKNILNTHHLSDTVHKSSTHNEHPPPPPTAPLPRRPTLLRKHAVYCAPSLIHLSPFLELVTSDPYVYSPFAYPDPATNMPSIALEWLLFRPPTCLPAAVQQQQQQQRYKPVQNELPPPLQRPSPTRFLLTTPQNIGISSTPSVSTKADTNNKKAGFSVPIPHPPPILFPASHPPSRASEVEGPLFCRLIEGFLVLRELPRDVCLQRVVRVRLLQHLQSRFDFVRMRRRKRDKRGGGAFRLASQHQDTRRASVVFAHNHAPKKQNGQRGLIRPPTDPPRTHSVHNARAPQILPPKKPPPQNICTRLADGVEDVRDVERWAPVFVEDVRTDFSRVGLHVGVVNARHKLHLRSRNIRHTQKKTGGGNTDFLQFVFTSVSMRQLCILYRQHDKNNYFFLCPRTATTLFY